MNEGMKRMWCKYAVKYYSAQRKKETLSFAKAWMNLEGVMLNETNWTETEKSKSFTYGIVVKESHS